MKKIICMALVIFTIAACLVGCGGSKKFTCNECGEEKTGKKHSLEISGEKATLCEECYKENKELFDTLKGLEDLY